MQAIPTATIYLSSRRRADILSLTSWVVHHRPIEAVHLVGTQGAGPWVAVAGALLRDHVDRVVIDTEGFRFAQVERLDDVQFLPGGARYGDLPGFLALRAPAQTLLLGETPETVKVALEAYTAAAAADALKFLAGTDDDDESSAAVGDWLIAP